MQQLQEQLVANYIQQRDALISSVIPEVSHLQPVAFSCHGWSLFNTLGPILLICCTVPLCINCSSPLTGPLPLPYWPSAQEHQLARPDNIPCCCGHIDGSRTPLVPFVVMTICGMRTPKRYQQSTSRMGASILQNVKTCWPDLCISSPSQLSLHDPHFISLYRQILYGRSRDPIGPKGTRLL